MNPYLNDLMAFADLLAACNVIDEDAVCFADEYDGGTTLGNIAEAHRRLNAEETADSICDRCQGATMIPSDDPDGDVMNTPCPQCNPR
jgi:hypothetical protein